MHCAKYFSTYDAFAADPKVFKIQTRKAGFSFPPPNDEEPFIGNDSMQDFFVRDPEICKPPEREREVAVDAKW